MNDELEEINITGCVSMMALIAKNNFGLRRLFLEIQSIEDEGVADTVSETSDESENEARTRDRENAQMRAFIHALPAHLDYMEWTVDPVVNFDIKACLMELLQHTRFTFGFRVTFASSHMDDDDFVTELAKHTAHCVVLSEDTRDLMIGREYIHE